MPCPAQAPNTSFWQTYSSTSSAKVSNEQPCLWRRLSGPLCMLCCPAPQLWPAWGSPGICSAGVSDWAQSSPWLGRSLAPRLQWGREGALPAQSWSWGWGAGAAALLHRPTPAAMGAWIGGRPGDQSISAWLVGGDSIRSPALCFQPHGTALHRGITPGLVARLFHGRAGWLLGGPLMQPPQPRPRAEVSPGKGIAELRGSTCALCARSSSRLAASAALARNEACKAD